MHIKATNSFPLKTFIITIVDLHLNYICLFSSNSKTNLKIW